MSEVIGIPTGLLMKIITYMAIAAVIIALLLWIGPAALEAAQTGIKTATGG